MKPTLATRTSQKLVSREARSERFLEVSINTPRKESTNRPPLNLSIVIDRSGSMGGDKIVRAKQAAEYILDQLTERDRVSIVIYDSTVDAIVPANLATTDHIRRCKSALREVYSRGMTALFDGWTTGCNEIADSIQPGTASRVLLLTDGLANVGLTDSPGICEHVRALFERGISTSTFGIGADFDEDLLSDMADAGRGRFYYIEHAGLIPDAFRQEFGDLVAVVASKANLEVEMGSGIQAELLGGIPHESDGSRIVVNIGDLYEGESRPYYFKLSVPGGVGSDTADIRTLLSMEIEARPASDRDDVSLRYASEADVAAETVDKDVMRKVADVAISDARIEAMKFNRAGRYDEARHMVHSCMVAFDAHRSSDLRAEDLAFAADMAVHLDPVKLKMEKAGALRRSRVRTRREE